MVGVIYIILNSNSCIHIRRAGSVLNNSFSNKLYGRSSKSDSAPVRGEAYEPTGLRTQ